ncbi:MAG TPA: VanZ family protein [Mycobacteriales bacterium]|nr:VanZ family protein [Mycobacteriales bacterium]
MLASVQRWSGPALVLLGVLSLYLFTTPQPSADPGFPGADKLVHAGLFAGLAFSARFRFAAHPVALLTVLAYAVASELIQAVALPTRAGDVNDLIADVAGLLGGWLVARALAWEGAITPPR